MVHDCYDNWRDAASALDQKINDLFPNVVTGCARRLASRDAYEALVAVHTALQTALSQMIVNTAWDPPPHDVDPGNLIDIANEFVFRLHQDRDAMDGLIRAHPPAVGWILKKVVPGNPPIDNPNYVDPMKYTINKLAGKIRECVDAT